MIRTVALALALSSVAITARAATIPPPGFDTWVSHGSPYCFDPQPLGVPVCDGAEGFLPIENRVHPTWAAGSSVIGGGSASANQLTAFLSFDGITFTELFSSVRDTYTVSGPDGSVDITVHLSAEAHSTRPVISGGPFSGLPNGQLLLFAAVAEGIGANGRSLVNQLGGATDEVQSAIGELETDLFADVVVPLTVTANSPFPLAFQLALTGTSTGEGDALNTAVIDFTVPAGYTLTSQLGWTAVPEPSRSMLTAVGLLGACVWRKRRR